MDSTLRRNTLILIGSLGAILSLYVFAYWLPHHRQIAEMRRGIQDKREMVSLQEQQIAQRTMLHDELGHLETYNQSIANRIPSALDVKEFLTVVHSLGQKEGVAISSVTPGITSELIGVQQQSVRLTMVGRFRAIVQMMYELETMARIVDIMELDAMSSTKPGETEDAIDVKLDVRLFARPTKAPVLLQNSG